jgi:MFS family permease
LAPRVITCEVAATGVTSPIVGGLVVSALTFSGAIAVLGLRNTPARRILSGGIPALVSGVAITLAGVQMQHVSLMLVGTVVAGIGFGAAFSGSMRTVFPHAEAHERAGLLSAFYVEGYLSFSLPAILTGLVAPLVGLPASRRSLWRGGDCARPLLAAGHVALQLTGRPQ